MKKAAVEKLLSEFSERSMSAAAAEDYRTSNVWHAAWELLHEAHHQAIREEIQAASDRRIAKIKRSFTR